MQEKIKYYGAIGLTNGYYRIEFFDKIQDKRIVLEKNIKCTFEEAQIILAKAQYEFYKKYPRLLPKYIFLVKEYENATKYFQFSIPGPEQSIYIDSFTTIQDAIWAKKDLISRLVD
jgi:hypothetical protein